MLSIQAALPSVPLLLLVCYPLLWSAPTPHLVTVIPLGLSILVMSIPIQVRSSLLHISELPKKVTQKKNPYLQYASVMRKHGGLIKIGLTFRRKKRKSLNSHLGHVRVILLMKSDMGNWGTRALRQALLLSKDGFGPSFPVSTPFAPSRVHTSGTCLVQRTAVGVRVGEGSSWGPSPQGTWQWP